MRTGQGVGCRKYLHPRSDLIPEWPQTSTLVPHPAARPPDRGTRETLLPACAKTRPQPPFLGSHSPPHCSPRRCWAVAPRAGSGLLQPGGRARVSDRDSRQARRVPGGAGGVGNPGGSREGRGSQAGGRGWGRAPELSVCSAV